MIETAPFLGMRRKMAAFADSMDEAKAFTIPDGFNNNIAWHLGHVAVTQQLLCYRLSGVDLHVEEPVVDRFRKGTSPKEWGERPELKDISGMLVNLAETFVHDWEAGRFEAFKPYMTSAGVELTTLREAFLFNHIHEGMHFGQVLMMARLL